MSAKDIGYLSGVAISLVMAGASLKQQGDETSVSSQRIEDFKTYVGQELSRMRLELDGTKADSKADHDLLIQINERLKNIETAVTKKGRP